MRHFVSSVSVAIASALAAGSAVAATVAVIDSGVDIRHTDLSAKIWVNAGETASNSQDDDGNGYADDINGWNFAESNNQVIDYQYLDTFSPDCERYFAVQGKVMLGTATDEEKEWMRAKREDAAFISELSTFGNFVHGSHVSGIAAHMADVEEIVAVKIIPTKQPGLDADWLAANLPAAQAATKTRPGDPITDALIQYLLTTLADQQGALFAKIGAYVHSADADVANGSFGVSVKSVKPIVESVLSLLGQTSEADVKRHSIFFVERIVDHARKMVQASPETLFVFAAGNDATDNDAEPVAPANVGEPNSMTVAATLSVSSVATFSNFGAAKVDVAAPGVVIRSTIPGNKYLEMSGTSMASPYVANAAALVQDENPELTAADIKRILMETVDVKDFLAGKVRSSGIVNTQRAVAAARMTKTASIDAAILAAQDQIADVPESKALRLDAMGDVFAVPLPSPF